MKLLKLAEFLHFFFAPYICWDSVALSLLLLLTHNLLTFPLLWYHTISQLWPLTLAHASVQWESTEIPTHNHKQTHRAGTRERGSVGENLSVLIPLCDQVCWISKLDSSFCLKNNGFKSQMLKRAVQLLKCFSLQCYGVREECREGSVWETQGLIVTQWFTAGLCIHYGATQDLI